jgi:Fe-S cluster biogenesis protein NfuA
MRRAPWFVALVLVGACSGCTGSPASTSSWQSSSDRAIGELISGLGTARIVVEQERRNRLPHTYSTQAVTDAIETSSREISSYIVGQPPDALHRANQTVTLALHDAEALLVEVRVAVASPGLTPSSAHALLTRIDAMRDQLDSLDKAVMKAPGSVGSS